MLRYRLRTLLILLAMGPPVLAGAWWGWQAWKARHPTRIPIFAPSASRIIEVTNDKS